MSDTRVDCLICADFARQQNTERANAGRKRNREGYEVRGGSLERVVARGNMAAMHRGTTQKRTPLGD